MAELWWSSGQCTAALCWWYAWEQQVAPDGQKFPTLMLTLASRLPPTLKDTSNVAACHMVCPSKLPWICGPVSV